MSGKKGKIILLATIIFLTNNLLAQFYSDHEYTLNQNKLDLQNNCVLLSFAYQPSEEDAVTLAYYRYKFGTKIYSVFLTRGEGGYSEIGPEYYQELGAVRSLEAQRAERVLGTDAYFLNCFDAGCSRNINEVLEKWGGKDSVLSKIVYIIRKMKPDVIISGKGYVFQKNNAFVNKDILNILLPEAVDSASSSEYSRKQFSDPTVKPWQVKKLFFQIESYPKKQKNTVIIPVNEINAEKKISYLELAKNAFKEYRSYGIDVSKFFNSENIEYELAKSDKKYKNDPKNLLSEISCDFKDSKNLYKAISILLKMDPSQKDKQLTLSQQIDDLVDLMRKDVLPGKFFNPLKYRVLSMLKFKLNDYRVTLLGIKVKKFISDSDVCPRQQYSLTFDTIYNLPSGDTKVFFFNTDEDWVIIRGKDYKNNFKMIYHEPILIVPPERVQFTKPAPVYQYTNYSKDPSLRFAIIHTSKDPKYNFQYFDTLNYNIVPRAIFKVTPEFVYLNDERMFKYDLWHYLNDYQNNIRPRISNPEYGKSISDTFNMDKKYADKSGEIKFILSDSIPKGTHNLFFTVGKPVYSRVVAKKFDCKVDTTINIGLIGNNDNVIERFFTDLKVKYKLITSPELQTGNLNDYTSIIIDMGSFLNRNDLIENNQKIKDYIFAGGNLLVLSQQNSGLFDPYKFSFLPFEFEISKKSIVEENSKVSILDPGHPFFNYPNRMTRYDWDNWIQERGLFFPEKYSNEIKELVSLSDSGEPEIRSGILFGKYGKGTCTYTCLSWNRQLYSVVEGAYRIFANMISQRRGQ